MGTLLSLAILSQITQAMLEYLAYRDDLSIEDMKQRIRELP